MKAEDLSGKVYGRLTVVALSSKTTVGKRVWSCVCQCGGTTDAVAGNLKNGHTKSCGCFKRERTIETSVTHGLTGTTEYRSWRSMLLRCRSKSGASKKNYSGRGITVDPQWLDFEQFLLDMGPKPTERHSIDRIDNDKGYSKDNCRWATSKEQGRNTRANRILEYRDKKYVLTDLAILAGMDAKTLHRRLHLGWSVPDAVERPLRQR